MHALFFRLLRLKQLQQNEIDHLLFALLRGNGACAVDLYPGGCSTKRAHQREKDVWIGGFGCM